jgi:hypothetical protein
VIDGIPHRAELREVGLSDQDRAVAPQAADDLGITARAAAGEQPGAVGRGHPGHVDDFLDRERHAVERAERLAVGGGGIGCDGLRARRREARQDDCVDGLVACAVALGVGIEQLDATHLACAHRMRHPARRPLDEIAHGAVPGWRGSGASVVARSRSRIA